MAAPIVPKICAVDECDNPKHAGIYCAKHYYRFKTHGDPLGGRRGASPGEPLRWIYEHAKYQGDDCLSWPYQLSRYGYGVVRVDGKSRVASRVMCEIAHGLPTSQSLDAAHSCGNGHKGCMNPNHLSWKTRSQNNADKLAHGTHRQGEAVHSSKITEAQAEQIILMRGKMKQREIAAALGISANIVRKIHSGTHWKHVADRLGYKFQTKDQRDENAGNNKLSAEQALEIRRLRGSMTCKEIGALYGIDPSYVSKIQRGVLWGWLKDSADR